jgi:hypothetical protein
MPLRRGGSKTRPYGVDFNISFIPILILSIFLLPLLVAPASAREIRDRETLTALMREVASAATPAEVHRILKRYGELPAREWTMTDDDAHGVIWFDNSLPRARIMIPGIKADACFRDLLGDEYLLEAVDVAGRIDLELEVRADAPAIIRGRLRLHQATLRWTMGDFALLGVNGSIPFQRTIGVVNTSVPSSALSTTENVRIDTMIWSNRPVAVGVAAVASYTDRIMRFEQIRLKMLGGLGVGSVVFDHRGRQWRAASMLRFENVNLMRLPEILPSIPAMARVTMATIKGQISLVYAAPDQLNLTGKIESMAPGVIELSPQMREIARDLLDSRVIRFQRLTIDLGRDRRGELEARVSLYRRTGQSIFSFFRGEPFAPYMLTIRFPIIPFVRQLSQY